MRFSLVLATALLFAGAGCAATQQPPVMPSPAATAPPSSEVAPAENSAATPSVVVPALPVPAVQEPVKADSATPPAPPEASAKSVIVTASNFSFSPSEIKVKEGDVVTIKFVNSGGFHDWVVDEFSARTPKLQGGATASVTFTANKKGTFEYYCSVGSHRAMGMKGNLIVE